MKNELFRRNIHIVSLFIIFSAFLLSVASCEPEEKKVAHTTKTVVINVQKKHAQLKRVTPVVQDID